MAVGVGDMPAVVIDLKRWFGFVGHQSNLFHFSSGLLARRCGSVLSRPRLLIGGPLRRLSPRWFKRLRSATSAAVLVLWCAARSVRRLLSRFSPPAMSGTTRSRTGRRRRCARTRESALSARRQPVRDCCRGRAPARCRSPDPAHGPVIGEIQGLLGERVQIGRLPLFAAATRVLEHASDDAVGAATALHDFFQISRQHTDRLDNLGTFAGIECTDRARCFRQLVQQFDGEACKVIDEI